MLNDSPFCVDSTESVVCIRPFESVKYIFKKNYSEERTFIWFKNTLNLGGR